jgi:glycogen debranching enzyme
VSAGRKTPVYKDITGLIEGCYACLGSLEVTGSRWGREYHYYRPALTKYGAGQWLWDSGWHIIAWSHRRPENAIAELRTLLSFQRSDGFIPEIIFWRPGWLTRPPFDFLVGYSRREYTDLTQMPMLAYSVRAIWNATHDVEILREFVPKIVDFLAWWEGRDPDGDGLVSIIHPWESGIDASPAYDPVFRLDNPGWCRLYPRFWKLHFLYRRLRWDQAEILRRERFNVEDVGVCSVYAAGWEVLASLAREFDTGLAASCRRSAAKYSQAVIRKCWDPERGRFVSYFHQDGEEKVTAAETVQTLLPLLLDDLPADIASRLVAGLTDPARFWLSCPVPSVARREATFNPGASRLLWRGPMWPATTWLVMEGLLKHGFSAEARAVLERWTGTCLRSGIWEYYNPLTGKGLGQPCLGMSNVIVDMLFRLKMA